MKKNSRLLIQYGIIFVIIFLITIMGIVHLARLGFREQARVGESETAYSQAYQVANYIYGFNAYPFYLQYWSEHKDELVDYIATSTRIMEENPELMVEYGAFSVFDFTMEDIEGMSDAQKTAVAMMAYTLFNNQFNFVNSIEKSTLDGPILVKVNEDSDYTVLVDTSEHGFARGDIISFKKTQKKYDFTKDAPEDIGDNIFFFVDKENDYFSGVIAPIVFENKMIAFTIIEIREDYLKKISFKYTNMVVGVIALFTLSMSVLLGYLMYRNIYKPLSQVHNALRVYANTLDTELVIHRMNNVKSNNEIGRLAEDIIKVARKVSAFHIEESEIAAEKARLQSEIDFAAEIQNSMLPDDLPDSDSEKRFEISGYLAPKETVGADVYDFIYIDDDHVALMIADVSGSGMAAALFMMDAINQIKGKAEQGKAPADILTEVNCDIIEHSKDDLFITVWLMIIELSTGKAIEANAGHVRPAFCRSGEQFNYIANKHALPLGVMKSFAVTENEWQLKPGDKIFVYTDGVTGAANKEKKLFGAGRLQDSLNEAKDLSQMEILDHIKENLEKFLGNVPIADDLTMLGFTYKGPEH